MTTKEKKELFRKLNECRDEITKLKTTLNELDEQKENWFNKKEKHSDEIVALINKAKENKRKRDSLTKSVKTDKTQREKFNEETKKKISQLKESNKKKQELLRKHNIKEDPSRIKEEIEKLDLRIETDVMPFDREKELMKKIKDLKKKYEQSKEIRNICEKVFGASKEIDNLKGEARDIHRRIQSRAKKSKCILSLMPSAPRLSRPNEMNTSGKRRPSPLAHCILRRLMLISVSVTPVQIGSS